MFLAEQFFWTLELAHLLEAQLICYHDLYNNIFPVVVIHILFIHQISFARDYVHQRHFSGKIDHNYTCQYLLKFAIMVYKLYALDQKYGKTKHTFFSFL